MVRQNYIGYNIPVAVTEGGLVLGLRLFCHNAGEAETGEGHDYARELRNQHEAEPSLQQDEQGRSYSYCGS
jgi:hypothetical protein